MVAASRLTELNFLGKQWSVQVEIAPVAETLRPGTWSRESLRWATVTPILLDRFPKKKGPTVEDLIRLACAWVGLPEPGWVEHGPFSNLEGVPPVPEFKLIRKKGEQARWGVHAEVEFREPVRGPILLGAGRFFGMGLMKPVVQEAE